MDLLIALLLYSQAGTINSEVTAGQGVGTTGGLGGGIAEAKGGGMRYMQGRCDCMKEPIGRK